MSDKEYRLAAAAQSGLLYIRGVPGVALGDRVTVSDHSGRRRNGQVIRTSEELVLIQVLEGIEYSRQAARTAEKQLAYEEAAHHLNNAIAALALKRAGDDPIQGELFCDLGEAQFRAGDLSEARGTCLKAADIARRVKKPELFARAVVAAGRTLSNSGVTDHGLVLLLNEAREMLGQADSPLMAQVLARLGIELYWSEREHAVALCQQAVDMAKRLDDPHASIVALWCRCLSLRNPNSLVQRLARHARSDHNRGARRGARNRPSRRSFFGTGGRWPANSPSGPSGCGRIGVCGPAAA